MDLNLTPNAAEIRRRTMSERNYNALDGEQKFYLGVVASIAMCFCTFVGSIAAYNIYEAKAIKSLIEGGADPLSAGCAYNTSSVACAQRIAK
jgi:hypothetical protein